MTLWRTRLRVAIMLDGVASRLWEPGFADEVNALRREIDWEVSQEGQPE